MLARCQGTPHPLAQAEYWGSSSIGGSPTFYLSASTFGYADNRRNRTIAAPGETGGSLRISFRTHDASVCDQAANVAHCGR
jgi:hypothetical protein